MVEAVVPDARQPAPALGVPTRRTVLSAVASVPAYGDGVRPATPRLETDPAVPDVPAEFAAITAALRDALTATRAEVVLTETRAPSKIAPYSLALLASVSHDDSEIAVGRLVLLHDPDGQAAWDGTYRIACFARADVEAEMGADPMLSDVTWSWLADALEESGAVVDALAGTVTVTRSARFGALAEDDPDGAVSSEVELRCSWTPRWDDDPARHLHAFAQLLADLAGLPPDVPGVVALTARRR
jgi:hypothetical protein